MNENIKLKLASSNSDSQLFYVIDISPGSVEVGRSMLSGNEDPREKFALSFPNYGQTKLLTSKKFSFSSTDGGNQAILKIEQKLASLSERGLLSSSNFVLGYRSDPFHPFKDRFDFSLKLLKTFKKYPPGMLIIQTRSPIIVIGLDILKSLGDHLSINFGVETFRDDIARALSPEIPSPSERIRAAAALKRFGIDIGICVNPLLPYGNWQTDARKFAEILAKNANRVFVRPFVEEPSQRRNITSVLSRSLVSHWGRLWMGENACTPLVTAINDLFPEHLANTPRLANTGKQLSMFVA